MKRYIRTFMYNEDSVFEVIEEYEKTIKCKLTNCENGYIVIGKNNVVKQADTIEELCDRFVYEDTIIKDQNYRYEIYHLLSPCMDKKLIKLKHNIYGCIWTNKGLIYVAKMNSEGKLCLI